MQFAFFFSMILFALLEVVRNQFVRSYGVESKDSLGYVIIVSCAMLIMFLAFPDGE